MRTFGFKLAAPRRRGRPLEDGQPPPRIRGPPASTRKPKGGNLNASVPGPARVQPVPKERHTEGGLPIHVAGDEPQTQRENRFQTGGGIPVSISPYVVFDS